MAYFFFIQTKELKCVSDLLFMFSFPLFVQSKGRKNSFVLLASLLTCYVRVAQGA